MIEERGGKIYVDGKRCLTKYNIGSFTSGDTVFTVVTYGSELNKKPHFHLYTNDRSIKCAIGIYEPIYIKHKKSKGRLNESQIKDMIKWLQEDEYLEILEKYIGPYWQSIRSIWNTTYGNRIQPEHGHYRTDIPFPDYMKLLEY